MKIAVLADIHSNMDALQSVLQDAREQKADAYVVAGDIVSDGPSTREVVDCVRGLTGYIVKGNREDYMLKYRSGQFRGWEGSKQFSSLLWTYKSLSESDLAWMASLPEQTVMELGRKIALRIVHGSPFSMYELLKPDEDMSPVEHAALATPEQALVFGHNHMQWTGTVRGRLLLNPGSVGVHFNREAKAEYGMLTVDGGELSAELRRVRYDFEALERRLESSGLMQASPVWTKITFDGVKDGRNYCLAFLGEARKEMTEKGLPSGAIPNDIWDSVAERWWREKGWGNS
jgi:putative phosphoesterase